MSRPSVPILVSLVLYLSACTEPRQTLGQAYVAPQSLNLRSQISAKSGSVTTLRHGELVSIIDVQRKMVKVATNSGAEGWVDAFDLLSVDQMDALRKERQNQKALPAQGAATAFEPLNIHIEPSRRSPAFAQIAEGAAVEILGRTLAVKNAPPTKTSSLVVERPQPVKRPKKQKESAVSFRPPKPPPPKPPANWRELSAERIDGGDEPDEAELAAKKKEEALKAAQKAAEKEKPAVMEDWTLVRTKRGETGWVLTRNLMISIPDEVAQYAEGKRITSFFDLGTVTDSEKGAKHNWLWTTLSSHENMDFDSWRVFLWNLHKHRYETSYRQRDLEGYFPVQVAAPDHESKIPGRSFQIITKDDDGRMRKRTYLFDGTLVHLSGTEDVVPQSPVDTTRVNGLDTNKLENKAHPSWWYRQWSALTNRFSSH